MSIDTNNIKKAVPERGSAWLRFCSVAIPLLLLVGCGSTGTAAGESTADPAAVKTSTSEPPLGEIAYDERTRRDCESKKRRTGSRIARSACEDGVYGKAYHMEGSKDEQPTDVIPTSPR